MNTTAITTARNGNLSTCIAFAAYDRDTLTLDVEFSRTPGTIYTLRGVCEADWIALVNAPSLGKKWNQLFRGYPCTSTTAQPMALAA